MKFNLFYRPDIDGIRAIAVLLVILYHANFSFITGGYIGVDVFFVLSGFLITLTIDKEMNGNSFSFKQFYLRRIRRIIPVLVFVMLVVTIPACFLLFADDLESYSRTLLHTILSTNNFHLWIKQDGYFNENSDLIPFLHTWSLSVEEQFYFIWPPFLLLLHKKLSLQKRLLFILIFSISGIILSVYLTDINPSMAYFLLPARIFELSIGACLAMYWGKLPEFSKNKNSILSIIGLSLILIPAVLLNKSSIFPGMNAFWPCLGTALLIFTGKKSTGQGIVNTVLQNKLLVKIGLLSYSMYLWHWPIFVFIKYLGLNLDGTLRIFSLLLTVALSYFSWKFIEQPFRFKYKYNLKKTIRVVFLPSLLIIALIYGILDAKNGFPERFPSLTEFNPKTNFPNLVRKNCFDAFKIGNCDECFIGVKKPQLDGVLIGDSFANHTAEFLDVLAKDAGMYIHDSAAGGYPLLNSLKDDGTPIYPAQYGIDRLEYAKNFKTIFIAANWEGQSGPDSKNYQSIINTLAELIKLGKKIVIFDPLRSTTLADLQKEKLFKTNKGTFFKREKMTVKLYDRGENYIINEIKRKFPSIVIIDLNDVMCKGGECNLEINNNIVYRNTNHLNTSGARLIGEAYLKLKDNPLKKL